VSNSTSNNNCNSNSTTLNGPYKLYPWEQNYGTETEKKHWITDNSESNPPWYAPIGHKNMLQFPISGILNYIGTNALSESKGRTDWAAKYLNK
jgi:hypothetical protein